MYLPSGQSVQLRIESADLRVQLLEVRVDKPLLVHFDELIESSSQEVALRLERAVVHLTNDLDNEDIVGWCRGEFANGTVFGVGSP